MRSFACAHHHAYSLFGAWDARSQTNTGNFHEIFKICLVESRSQNRFRDDSGGARGTALMCAKNGVFLCD